MLTADFRSFCAIGAQTGSPSRLTSTAGVLLKKTGGGSAFTPSMFLGMIWLVSMLARTRSSAITRSSSGTDAAISASTVCNCSRGSVGKLGSVILKSEKLTRRSSTATLVSDSTLSVPSAGLAAPFAV